MVTIEQASLAEGYSGHDHLITGRECADVVGRRFHTVARASAAADAVARRNGDRKVIQSGAHVALVIRMASGERRHITT